MTAPHLSREDVERLVAEATKGPWRAASRASSVVGLPVCGPQGAAICNVHARDEALANAHLIAAVHDLASTCLFFMDENKRLREVLGDIISVGFDCLEAIDRAALSPSPEKE